MNAEGSEHKPRASFAKSVIMPTGAGCGIGFLTMIGLAYLVLHLGYCIAWGNAIPNGSILILSSVFFLTLLSWLAKKPRPWTSVLLAIALVAPLSMIYEVKTTPRGLCSFFFHGDAPSDVTIHNGYYFQAGPDPWFWIHFSATPEEIMKVIQVHGMKKCQDDYLELERDHLMQWPRRPVWWTPQIMSNAMLFSASHPITSNQNCWGIGIWVNQATNEVYGYKL